MRRLGLFVCLVLGLGFAQAQELTFTLTILHTNDTHAHHEGDGGGSGGVARQAAVVQQIRAEQENVLLLDAGDRFTGTLFHTLYQGSDQVQIMNALGYDAMMIGNHEFDNGEETLQLFAEQVAFPIVVSNADWASFDDLARLIQPSAIIELGSLKVGVLGLIKADTPDTASIDPAIRFSDAYAQIVAEQVEALSAQGVDTIILMTHLGLRADEALIPQLRGVDVVVGGDSHTVLSNSLQGDGAYPLIVNDADGLPVYYVQAGWNNQYLGRLDLEVTLDGEVTSAQGDLIYLSRYITPDAELSAIVADLATSVENLKSASTNITLGTDLVGDRSVCRVEECDLGNLLADALRAEVGAQIAFMNSGGIRADLAAGDVTYGQILEVQPFGNLLATMSLTGADIRAALENSVSRIALNEAGQVRRGGANGRFLQVSGLRFSYDPTQEVGSRVLDVEVMQADGSYAPLDEAASYRVATIDFLRGGGDGYSMFRDNASDPNDFGRIDYEVTLEYMASLGQIDAGLVDAANPRIRLVNAELEPR